MRKEERRRKTPPEKPTPTAANDAEKLKKYTAQASVGSTTSYRGGRDPCSHEAYRSSTADGIPS
jgi:hypothetical protein